MSQYIHGLHAGSLHDGYGSTGAQNMEDRPGWVVFTEIAGIDGGDYSLYHDWGFGVIVRLNHGYHPNGTIPERHSYPDFAVTCALHVKNSKGVDAWIIGNEPNHSQERPNGVPISSKDYADCFRACRDVIKSYVPDAPVVVAAVAPYNNETGDFGDYMTDILYLLGPGGYDGVAIHAYTHGADPALITSDQHMGPPFKAYHYNFRVYRDLVARIPDGVPVYLTETNQDNPWLDVNVGWVREMYREVDEWNTDNPARVIRCATLYRYPNFDRWYIAGKPSVVEDFQQAVDIGYKWTETEPPDPEPPDPPIGDEMINPSFEQPYQKQAGTAFVAAGWNYWYNQGDPPAEQNQGPLAMPEYKEAPIALDPHRVAEGLSAQCWFIQYKVMDGGVYQVVPTTQGKSYYYTVEAQTWCSQSDDPRADDGEMYLSLGIDPYGRTDPKAQGIVWSPWARVTANYETYASQKVAAQGASVTVYLRAWNKWKLKHNDIYVDDLQWIEEGVDPEPPDPPDPPDPEPTECKALTADQVRQIVREEIRAAFEDARYTF